MIAPTYDVALRLLSPGRMTRNFVRTRHPRITQPLRGPKPPRDTAIEDLGFTCFRLVMGEPVRLTFSSNSMFAFVRRSSVRP